MVRLFAECLVQAILSVYDQIVKPYSTGTSVFTVPGWPSALIPSATTRSLVCASEAQNVSRAFPSAQVLSRGCQWSVARLSGRAWDCGTQQFSNQHRVLANATYSNRNICWCRALAFFDVQRGRCLCRTTGNIEYPNRIRLLKRRVGQFIAQHAIGWH